MNGRDRQRACWLARLYPRSWRDRFPDFVELLAAELADGRPGARRDAVRAALDERLRAWGLQPTVAQDRGRSGLALLGATLLPFTGLALGLWSQRHAGAGGAPGPATGPLAGSGAVVAGAVGLVIVLAVLATLVVRRGSGAGRRVGGLVKPAVVATVAFGALSGAGLAVERSGWWSPAAAALPRTGSGQVLTLWVRGVVAPITPAWVHPALMARLPAGELFAVLGAPVSTAVLAAATAVLLGRLGPRRSGRALRVAALGAVGVMAGAVAAAGRWMLSAPTVGGAAPGHAADAVLVVMGGLLLVALAGARQLLAPSPPSPAASTAWQGGDADDG